MEDDQRYTRRTVIATGAAAAAALPGCTGDDEPDAGAGDQGDPDGETPTATAPSLAEFEYPDGASADGVEGGTLADAHRDAITGAGSLTLEFAETRESDQFTDSTEAVKRWSAAGVSVTTDDDVTETLWSPAGDPAGYVRMDTGFEQRYRIDNSAPSPERVTEVSRFENLVTGAGWGEATEVVEDAAGDYAVVYEASGVGDEESLRHLVYGDVMDFEATIAVSEAGHVSELAYDVTVENDQRTVQVAAEATVTAVGATDLAAPDWFETVEETGTRFEMAVAEDGEVIDLELVNGPEITRDAQVTLSADGMYDRTQLPEAISVGDRLTLAAAGDGDLQVAVNESPAETSPLGRFVRATVQLDKFTLFEGVIQR